MYCIKCGENNIEKAVFCKKCGKELNRVELSYTGFWVRFGAYFIDFIGLIIFAFILGILLGIIGMSDIFTKGGILIDYSLWIIYSAVFLSIWSTTPGKKIYGLEVLKEDEERLDFSTALKRAFLQPLSFFLLGAGFWNMNKNEKKQAWHDKSCHTIVIRVKKSNYILPIILTIIGIIVYFYIRSLGNS